MTAVRDDLGRLLVRTASDIDAMPWEPLGAPGVQQKILWRSGDIAVGLIQVAAGAVKPEHVHHGAHHHIWITAGSCSMVGQALAAGGYVYIPPGVPHAVTDVGEDGCEFLFTYRPLEQPPDDEWGNPV